MPPADEPPADDATLVPLDVAALLEPVEEEAPATLVAAPTDEDAPPDPEEDDPDEDDEDDEDDDDEEDEEDEAGEHAPREAQARHVARAFRRTVEDMQAKLHQRWQTPQPERAVGNGVPASLLA